MSTELFAAQIGNVLYFRGMANKHLEDGTSSPVKIGMVISEEDQLSTGPSSFIKIKLIDSSSINIGANTQVIVRGFAKGDPGMISLMKGQVRSFIQKKNIESDKSTFFIRTKNAAIGVRGTDFITGFNPQTGLTNLDVIRGTVQIANIPSLGAKIDLNPKSIDQRLNSNSAIQVKRGMRTSVLAPNIRPINPTQIPKRTLMRLEKNEAVIIDRPSVPVPNNIKDQMNSNFIQRSGQLRNSPQKEGPQPQGKSHNPDKEMNHQKGNPDDSKMGPRDIKQPIDNQGNMPRPNNMGPKPPMNNFAPQPINPKPVQVAPPPINPPPPTIKR